jgi:transketolase
MSFEAAVHAKAIQLDRTCLEMCATAGSGHPTSAMSLGHIVTVLLYHTMRWLPDHPRYPSSDRLVLSEGHAVPILYAAFADLGGAVGQGEDRRPLTTADLASLRENDSCLDGHPNPMEGFPFFDAATGSLGQGLSVAAGLAIAARKDDLSKRIYCLVGDGEAREGQIAEALDLIVDHRLSAVLPIFNCNGFGQADRVSEQQSPERLAAKLEAIGFNVLTIDGHAPEAIRDAFAAHAEAVEGGATGAPMAVVARTVKGWGAPCIQGGGWHGRPAVGEKLEQAVEELTATGVGLTSALAADELRIYPPVEFEPPTVARGDTPTFTQAMEQWDMGLLLRSGKLATRRAFGVALRVLGHRDPNVFALDGDVRNSTFSEWFCEDKDLADRYVECKIGEQNMISTAVGLAAAGKIPFCSSFAKFITRAYDQIEMAVYSGANIKLVGSHSGISLAADGPSQMGLPDVAWFRSWSTVKDHRGNPACYILQPADAYAAYGLTLAMAEHHGLCYLRTVRPDVEFIYDENHVFDLGRFEVLTEGRDLLIVTAGFMVHECNKALDAPDRAESGDAFTVEQLYVRRLPKSARTSEEILRQCGLHHTSIAKAGASMLGVVNV